MSDDLGAALGNRHLRRLYHDLLEACNESCAALYTRSVGVTLALPLLSSRIAIPPTIFPRVSDDLISTLCDGCLS